MENRCRITERDYKNAIITVLCYLEQLDNEKSDYQREIILKALDLKDHKKLQIVGSYLARL